MTSVHQRHPEFQADQRQFFDELITEAWDSYESKEWDAARRLEIDLLFKIVHAVNVNGIQIDRRR